AEAVAGELGLALYVIDLSTVVDKYIGETEKNLERIFAEAAHVNGVLLFDEADALFGKRSGVEDARDRYANVEVSYLLQRIESFDGVALLTSNLRGNVDEAFARRLDAVVEMPLPDEAARLRLWHVNLPQTLPRDDGVDLTFLARFELSGGNVRNASVSAAYRAAAADRAVTMHDLVRGVAQEYTKLGRLCTEGEFGDYHALVTGASAIAR
ncbi:MAG TPA: ATP-binding protein, partial [Actinomycetota bacterium]|nr:ATP-binding protein [Actinomycetota bacterium]